MPSATDPGPAMTPPPLSGNPLAYSPDTAAPAMIRYSPTRPGTTVATALEAQPVEDVTPATTYTVTKGDSLWTVAKKNHLTVNDLALANKLKAGAALHVGQKLILPAKSGALSAQAPASGPGPAPAAKTLAAKAPAAVATTPRSLDTGTTRTSADSTRHVVKPGETLGAIARHYGVKVGDVATANNISDPRRIHPGQELIIPGRQAGAAGPGTTAKTQGGTQPVKTIVTTPGPDQDLDANIKPAAAGDVPVIKVDDNAAAPPAKP
jgi:LysM repeat protein